MDEIARLSALQGSEINEAKKILANETTALMHGRAAADEASATARQTFEEGTTAQNLPTFEVSKSDLANGIGILVANVTVGFVKSNGEARRQIQSGGIRVNDVPVTDEKMVLTPDHVSADGVIKLSMGKKRHALIKAV